MAECPTCENTYDTKRGMRYHHSVTHGKSIAKGRETTTLTCENCGEDYEYRKDKAERSTYCSRECLHEGRGGWAEREERECDTCEDTFTTHPNDSQRFCSPSCFYSWNADHMSGEDSPLNIQEEVTCAECGNTFTKAPSEIELREEHYCSQECYHANYTGKDAPRWRGGSEEYYGPTWRPQRQKALERDDYECCDCGMSREEHYTEYGRDLEVHHKTPFRTFDDSAEANQLSNLITLCTNCHMNREHSIE